MKSELVCFPFRWNRLFNLFARFLFTSALFFHCSRNHEWCFLAYESELKWRFKVKNYCVLITLIKSEQWRDINCTIELWLWTAPLKHSTLIIIITIFERSLEHLNCLLNVTSHLKYWLWLIAGNEKWQEIYAAYRIIILL